MPSIVDAALEAEFAKLPPEQQAKIIDHMYSTDPRAWFLRFGWLRDEKGVITQFPKLKLRVVQEKILAEYMRCRRERRPVRIIVLKPRKAGASTIIQAIAYHHLRYFGGRSGAIMGDIASTGANLVEMFRGFATHDAFNWPDKRGPLLVGDDTRNLSDEVTLMNDSLMRVSTAGSSNSNRSGTIQVAVMEEVAFYPTTTDRDPALGFLGSWTSDGESSAAFMCSTACGPAGVFYRMFFDDRNNWCKTFVSWWEEPENMKVFENEAQKRDFIRTMDKFEKEEQDRYRVSHEQLFWRREKMAAVCGNDPDKFAQEFPSDPESAFLRKSRTRFAISIVAEIERRAQVYQPEIGHLALNGGEAVFVADDGGSVHIYERPRIGLSYLLVFDPCSGEDQQTGGQRSDPDEHSIGVWRAAYVNAQGEMFPPKRVASHSSRLEGTAACEVAYHMGEYYGGCICLVEINGVGLFYVKKMIELGAQVWSRPTPNTQAGTFEKAAGWATTPVTRRTIIDHLAGLVAKWKPEAPTFEAWDLKLILQLKKFIRNAKGVSEAMPGEHDDVVIESSIALYNISAATEYRQRVVKPIDYRKVLQREGWALAHR